MAKKAVERTGSTFADAAGNIIDAADAKSIATAYRAMAEALVDEGEELSDMTDDQAAAIVRAIPGKGPAIDLARAQALADYDALEEALDDVSDVGKVDNGPVIKSVSANKLDRSAVMVGEALDEATIDHWRQFAIADELVNGTPVIMATDIKRQFKIDEVLAWPMPGTRQKGKNAAKTWPYAGFNGPFDHYDHTENGGIASSHYRDEFRATKFGRDLNRLCDLMKKITKDTGDAALLPGEANEIDKLQETLGMPGGMTSKEMAGDETKRTALLQRYTTIEGRIVGKWRRSVALIHKTEEIEDLHGFSVQSVTTDKELLSKLRSPLEIAFTYKDEEGKTRVATSGKLSVGSLLRMNVRKARAIARKEEKSVDLATLKAASKKTKDPTPGGTARKVAVSVDQFYDACISAAGYAVPDNMRMIEASLDPEKNKKEDIIARLKAYGALHVALRNVMQNHNQELELIEATELEVREADARERRRQLALQNKAKARDAATG